MTSATLAGLQKMRIAWEEPFGPVVPIIRVKTVEDAIDHCNANNLALQVSGCALMLEELSCVHVGTPSMSGMFSVA